MLRNISAIIFLILAFQIPSQAGVLSQLVQQRAESKNLKKFVAFTDSISQRKLLHIDRTVQWDCQKDISQFIGNFWQTGFRFSETRTEGRLLLDEMVRQRDTVMLNKWLQSPLPRRQAYAVDGFYQLNKRGIRLSAQQRKRIDAAKSRDAALSFCIGNTHSIKRLKDVTKGFVF